ncbi:MAG: RluA family pseudouridine synthase [Mariprofundaceae bacterium]|nr:RluA family pseudouridine synthase [Mariprofundaceae bacterium]
MLVFKVEAQQHGLRLDVFLGHHCDLSRQRIQQLLRDGQVEGKGSLKPSAKVVVGMMYGMTIPKIEPLQLKPENIALDILYEDDELLIVNKAPYMVVHPSHGHDTGTLVHALLHHCPSLPGINGVERPGIVHRIDKGTSGSLVVAKTEAAHRGLSGLFATHSIQREYVAWCRGMPCWKDKRIESYLARHPHHRKKMAVGLQGKHAITDACVEKLYSGFSKIRLRLHTGRTHQIRVHLSHERFPLLGDETYARRFQPAASLGVGLQIAIGALNRQALHAEVLGFIHPVSKKHIQVSAPLPSDLVQLSVALEGSCRL